MSVNMPLTNSMFARTEDNDVHDENNEADDTTAGAKLPCVAMFRGRHGIRGRSDRENRGLQQQTESELKHGCDERR